MKLSCCIYLINNIKKYDSTKYNVHYIFVNVIINNINTTKEFTLHYYFPTNVIFINDVETKLSIESELTVEILRDLFNKYNFVLDED